MLVKEIMSTKLMTCSPSDGLRDVSQKMLEGDCGAIPVVEGDKVVGIITDRDIVCRAIAMGKNPLKLKAKDCMTTELLTARPDMSVEECCNILEEHQIRRIPIVDEGKGCCGILSQADVALNSGERETAELVREVSKHD